MSRPKALIFDVNETLLDLTSLRPIFADHVGDESLLPAWFGMLLRYSLEVTVLDDYLPFDQLARNALTVVSNQSGLSLDVEAIDAVVSAMEELPAHPDVAPALERLSSAGFTIATLTNSRLEAVTNQLTNAGIISRFDSVLSVEAVGLFKPHPRTYHWAVTEQLGLELADVMLVAAHDWDVSGALQAGLQAAFVERRSATRAPHAHLPSIQEPTLTEITDILLEMN